jgi:hypothetical protein
LGRYFEDIYLAVNLEGRHVVRVTVKCGQLEPHAVPSIGAVDGNVGRCPPVREKGLVKETTVGGAAQIVDHLNA